MFRIIILFFLLNFFNPAFSSIKEKIVLQMKITENLSFDFIQTINNKKQNGHCTIMYPKKIYCEYVPDGQKVIVSNGKSLVVLDKKKGNYYIYQLKKTPLELLLDKNYLIEKIQSLQPKDIDNKYLNFNIIEDNQKINIFFDKDTFNLIGWQTEDVYQNLIITFISSIKVNQKLNDKIFILPTNNW